MSNFNNTKLYKHFSNIELVDKSELNLMEYF